MQGFIVFWLVLCVIYFLPAIVAFKRSHRSTLAIFVLTFFLGWSGLCWIIALVWACTSNTESNHVVNVRVVNGELIATSPQKKGFWEGFDRVQA